MDDAWLTELAGSGGKTAVHALACCFNCHQLHIFGIGKMEECTRGIAAAAYAGDHVIRLGPCRSSSVSCCLISSLITDWKRATMSG